MPVLQERGWKFTCQVAAVLVQQTFGLYRTRIGERVRYLSWRTLTPAAAASTATWDIGDGVSATRYVAGVTAIQTVGAILDGAGTFLYQSIDTINVIYRPHAAAGVTAPTIEVSIIVQEEWPTTS